MACSVVSSYSVAIVAVFCYGSVVGSVVFAVGGLVIVAYHQLSL